MSSRRARSSASVPQGYQSTGLYWCWRRYGLVSPARRLGVRTRPGAVRVVWLTPPGSGGRRAARRPRPPEGSSSVLHLDAGPGLPVLPPQEPERQRHPERRRDDRARDPPDLLALDQDRRAGRRHARVGEAEADDLPVHVAAVGDAGHHLLAEVAALVHGVGVGRAAPPGGASRRPRRPRTGPRPPPAGGRPTPRARPAGRRRPGAGPRAGRGPPVGDPEVVAFLPRLLRPDDPELAPFPGHDDVVPAARDRARRRRAPAPRSCARSGPRR